MTPSHSSPPETGPLHWAPLLRVALLGTRQSPDPVPAVLADPSAPSGDADGREAQLLLSAGALALLYRAGHQPTAPPAAAPAPAPPENDAQPPLGPRGAQCLRRMAEDGVFADLLPGYLRDVAAARRRVPDAQLVPLLTHATRSAETAAELPAVLGARGRWLAALHPDWRNLLAPDPTATDAPDLTVWETGTPAQRRQWLRAEFRRDADRARGLLLVALPTEPAKVQEELLAVLADYLHPAAEPVLETLLRARGQEVRRHATALLARLPGAALVERLWARAEPLVRLKPGKLLGLVKPALEIDLPAWDKAWLADGIEEKPDQYAYAWGLGTAATPVGAGAARLGSLLALLPPGRWVAHLGASADELLGLALASEWAVPLLPAWATAAAAHHDADFAAALLRLWTHESAALDRAKVRFQQWPLTTLLPPAALHEILLEPLLAALRQAGPDWQTDWQHLERTRILPGPWPAALTRAALEVVARRTARTADLPVFHREQYRFGYFVTQTLLPVLAPTDAAWVLEFLQAIPEPHEFYQTQFQTLAETLHFQAELTASLQENAETRASG